MTSTSAIERQAIGRHGTIGSLYDIRTDKLEGTNLFNKELPSSLIKISDNAHLGYELDFNNSQKETFNKLNIEASLKLSLMSGLIDVGGSAKYLKQTKTDGRTVRVTFIYKVKTKQEHLQISMADLHDYFSSGALENSNATHVITGIMWGANIAATFEKVVQNHEKVEEIEGKLSLVLKNLSISGEAKLEYKDKNDSKFESLQISFSGDLLVDECPQTIEEVMSVFKKVPSLIKPLNDGKGQQLVFVLYPLEQMAKIFKHELRIDRLIREVSDLAVIRIEDIFDQISNGKRKFNDFLNEIRPWKDYISRDWQNTIRQKQSELAATELKTQRQLSTLLHTVRGGQIEETEIEKLLDKFDCENPCSLMSIEQLLKEKRHIRLKIQILKEFNPETNLLKEITSIEDKILELYEKDVYLLHISEKWQTEDKQNALKQLRYFKTLMTSEATLTDDKSDKQISKSAFIVIDWDLHRSDLEHDEHRATKCCIYYAKHGTIESKDYYEYSLKNLPRNQIVSILKENSNLSEKQVLDWHKAFMEEHPTGDLSKAGFVAELTKLLKSENAANYCDYIFTTIDKDKNGKISFCEFMSAIALTSIGNADSGEKRVGLISHVIHKNDKGGINAEELVKFIEVVTELVKGGQAVDTPNAKSIVKKMFKLCGKSEDDGEISKEEFLDCFNKDKQICSAFLPNISDQVEAVHTTTMNKEANEIQNCALYRFTLEDLVNAGELQYADKKLLEIAQYIVNKFLQNHDRHFSFLAGPVLWPMMYLLKREQNLQTFVKPLKRLLSKERGILRLSQRLLVDVMIMNSDRSLCRRLTSLLSKRNPVPMLQPSLSGNSERYRFMFNIVDIWDSSRPVLLSFGIGTCKGKTSLLNALFMTNFEQSLPSIYFRETIDVDFGYHFDKRRSVNIADAHGELSKEVLTCIASVFDGFLVQVHASYLYSNTSDIVRYLELLSQISYVLLLVRDAVDEDDDKVKQAIMDMRSTFPQYQIQSLPNVAATTTDESEECIDQLREQILRDSLAIPRRCENDVREQLHRLMTTEQLEQMQKEQSFIDTVRPILINGVENDYPLYSLFTRMCNGRLTLAKMDPYKPGFRDKKLDELHRSLDQVTAELQEIRNSMNCIALSIKLLLNCKRNSEVVRLRMVEHCNFSCQSSKTPRND